MFRFLTSTSLSFPKNPEVLLAFFSSLIIFPLGAWCSSSYRRIARRELKPKRCRADSVLMSEGF